MCVLRALATIGSTGKCRGKECSHSASVCWSIWSMFQAAKDMSVWVIVVCGRNVGLLYHGLLRCEGKKKRKTQCVERKKWIALLFLISMYYSQFKSGSIYSQRDIKGHCCSSLLYFLQPCSLWSLLSFTLSSFYSVPLLSPLYFSSPILFPLLYSLFPTSPFARSLFSFPLDRSPIKVQGFNRQKRH